MRPKSFANIHTHYVISQRQHVFRLYVIHSNCARLYGEKCKQKWLKINNKGGDWNKDDLSWNKDYSGLESTCMLYYSKAKTQSLAYFKA